MKVWGVGRVKKATIDNFTSKPGLWIRGVVAPLVKFVIRASAKKKFVVESYPDLEKKKQYIFVGVHTVTEDVATFLGTIDRNAYVLWGTTEQLEYNWRTLAARANGLAYVDRLDPVSRGSSVAKMVQVINSGTSVFLFPEGSLNNTEELLILELFSSVYDVAKATGAEVVVGVPYNELDRDSIYVKYLEPYDMTKFTYEQAELMVKYLARRSTKVLDLSMNSDVCDEAFRANVSEIGELSGLLEEMLCLGHAKYEEIKKANEDANEDDKPIPLEDVIALDEWNKILSGITEKATAIQADIKLYHKMLIEELTEDVKNDYYRTKLEGGGTSLTATEYLEAHLSRRIDDNLEISTLSRIEYLLKLISQIESRVALEGLRDKMATTMEQHMREHGSRLISSDIRPEYRAAEGLEPDIHMQWLKDRKEEYLHEKWRRDVWDEELSNYTNNEHDTPAEVRASLDRVWANSRNKNPYGPVLRLRRDDDKYDFKRYMKENWDK